MLCRLKFLVLALAMVPAVACRADDAVPIPEVGIDQRLNEQVPLDLTFLNEKGEEVSLRQCIGAKPTILVPAYFRCPRLCSVVLNNLVESLRKMDYEIGDQFTVVTVSIDPRETPELAAAKKAAYAEHYGRPGATTDWHFLTGKEETIARLAAAVGFRYFYDAERDLYSHASALIVLTPDGRISRYFFGLETSTRDLRFGLEDASNGAIGSPIERPLRMLCFAYDPVTGKYALLTMRLVRGGAVLTVLGLALVLLWARRREKRTIRESLTTGG